MCRTHHYRAAGPHRRFCGAFWVVAAGLGLVGVTSCVDSPRFWADREETHTLPTVGTRKVLIKAANGYVQVRAARQGADTIEVHALLRGGARSQDDAEECL